eukprot:evm.model.NODE_2531_length_39259_cov_31.881454.3
MKFTAVVAVAALASASAFVAPAPAASRAGPLAAAGKDAGSVGPNEYVPAGLTRAQWAEIKAKDAAKKATKKAKPAKVESLDEWQKAFEAGQTGHRFAKMKDNSWFKSR